ncbi:MAG TPA: glycosyltransferase family 4 protein [Pirellulales bacterium]|nr:glycosyltransferase family 4 protein [Pirellulales bacterium]
MMQDSQTINVDTEVLGGVETAHVPDGAAGTVPTGGLSGRRILFVMPSIPLQGMERATIQIMRILIGQGAEVLCVTERTYGDKVRAEVERLGARCIAIDCHVKLELAKNPRTMGRMFWHWARFALALRRTIREFRPTHIHITNISFFIYSFPAIWRTKSPVVFRLSNPPVAGLPRMKQAAWNWIWRRCVPAACDVLVCNSQFALAQLRARGVDFPNVVLLNNCLPERSVDGPSDIPPIRSDRFNIVYLGRIQPKKGCELLVDAAIRMLDEGLQVDVVLAGEYQWQNPFAEALIARVARAGCAEHIRFLGEVQDVFGLLDACDLHVHASLTESFSNAVLEAKSRGVPSVAFPCTSLPEQITHLQDGYLCSDSSSDALYEGIRFFVDHPEERRAAGHAARRSLERYSVERAARAWVQLYQEV